MRKYVSKNQREKGSALLLIMMMIIMLTILVMEISFSAQTAFSLAKNQIERAQMNAVSESAFAYAYNIVQIKSSTETQVSSTNAASATTNSTASAAGGASVFSKAENLNGGTVSSPSDNGPPWRSEFQVATVGDIRVKLKISLEETKININRLVNSEDKVDIRIRSALIELFKQLEGTEEDIDRIVDYIDTNTLGQYETGALNGQIQSIGELLSIPNISVKYSLEDNEGSDSNPPPPAEPGLEETKPLTLADIITVKSTGRININYASEDILKNIINGQQERAILETILQGRSKEPFKTLNQLALNKQFASTYKKLANYLTIDENTFHVKVIMKAKDNDIARIYYGYLYHSNGAPQYILRTERIGGNDSETIADSNDIPDLDASATSETGLKADQSVEPTSDNGTKTNE